MSSSDFEPPPPRWNERVLPEFVREWALSTMGDDDVDPIDYLDQEAGPGFAVAAAWLFCPETVEYRGGVFLRRRFTPENVDAWLAEHSLLVTQVTVNLTKLWMVFGGRGDLSAYDDQLLWALGECWHAVIQRRHPEHRIFVSVDADEEEVSYGPSITVWSGEGG